MRYLFLALLALPLTAPAQSADHPLARYIAVALSGNTDLKQRALQLEQTEVAAREARSAFLPTLGLNARYSVARGGRAFEMPIGDLVNPVYRNLDLLNQMASDASPEYPELPTYPSVENQREYFLRRSEQETFLRLAMPLWNPALSQHRRLQDELAAAEKQGLTEDQRQLVADVKTAYFQYRKAREGVRLYQSTMALVRENLRTSESLYRHHQVTIDEVYAAQAQVEQVDQELAEATKAERMAQAHFNTLLNRPHQAAIEEGEVPGLSLEALDLESAIALAGQRRETFRQLDHIIRASERRIDLEQSQALPNLNLAADYGIQGTNYNLEPDADYAMGSLVLQWNLFDRKRKHRVQQAQLARAELDQRRASVQQQITLQVIDAFYSLEAVRERRESAAAETKSARSAYRLIEKKYRQGQANQVELINARTQMTRAERRAIIAAYDYQIALAAFERAVGAFSFTNR